MAEPSGLYYMRARYYDPSVGRFISEDPLGFGGGDVNLFAYVQNDPVNRIDPLGLQAGSEVIGGIASGAGEAVGIGAAAAGAGVGVGIGIILYPAAIAEEPAIPSSVERSSVKDSCGNNDDVRNHCQEHFQRCLTTSLADEPGSTYGQSRCAFCREVCIRDGGWPLSAPTTKGSVSCNYGLFPRAY